MVLHGVADLAFGGADIDDQLLRADAVQNLRHQLHRRAHGHRHHQDVGLLHAGFQGHYFIGQADGERRLRRYGIFLHAQHRLCKAAALQIQRQRAADEAQADDT